MSRERSKVQLEKPSMRIAIGDSLTTAHLKTGLEDVPAGRSFTTSHIQKAIQQQPSTAPSNGETPAPRVEDK